MKLPKQQYTAEFKELAVTRVRDGQSAGAVAKELGLMIAATLGRAPSTVSLEIRRHGGAHTYRASEADAQAWSREANCCPTFAIGFSRYRT